MVRWYDQGFTFSDDPEFAFGLRQGHGGPCGVLAAVMAELIKYVLFLRPNADASSSNSSSSSTSSSSSSSRRVRMPSLTQTEVRDAFVHACVAILTRASQASGSGVIVLVDCPGKALQLLSPASDLVVHHFNDPEEVARCIRDDLDCYSARYGCVLFVLALVLTRDVDAVRSDMDVDSASSTLIGQFGHCTQELMNLLLTGYATSNVVDGHVSVSSGSSSGGDGSSSDTLVVKGVSKRSSVGYLSFLEVRDACYGTSPMYAPFN